MLGADRLVMSRKFWAQSYLNIDRENFLVSHIIKQNNTLITTDYGVFLIFRQINIISITYVDVMFERFVLCK